MRVDKLEMLTTFPTHLKDIREVLGLTEEAFGKLLNLKVSGYKYYEAKARPLTVMQYVGLRTVIDRLASLGQRRKIRDILGESDDFDWLSAVTDLNADDGYLPRWRPSLVNGAILYYCPYCHYQAGSNTLHEYIYCPGCGNKVGKAPPVNDTFVYTPCFGWAFRSSQNKQSL